jgi:hypothetical protein
MTMSTATPSQKVWDTIENERRRDRLVRRVSIGAWSVTFVLVLLLGGILGLQVAVIAKSPMFGAMSWMMFGALATPFLISLGVLSALIATLATVGVFLRMRTASLLEIQLRLAALEEMLTHPSDS